MCTYCYCGDQAWKWDPPWPKPTKPNDLFPWDPLIPAPANPLQPVVPWNLERLKEYKKLLEDIKRLEDELGCSCEPAKADHIGLLTKRIAALEKLAKRKQRVAQPGKRT